MKLDFFYSKFYDNNFKWFDSGCTVQSDLHVSNVLLTLDIDCSIIDYAVKNGFDTIIVHHSIGKHYYEANNELNRKIRYMEESGFSSANYLKDLEQNSLAIKQSFWNVNKITVTQYAKRCNINVISAHSIIDDLVYKKLFSILVESNYSFSSFWNCIVQQFEILRFKRDFGLTVETRGPCRGLIKKPFIDVSFAFPASEALISCLCEQECDLIISTYFSNKAIETYHKTTSFILFNHLHLDLIGLETFSDIIQKTFPSVHCFIL